MKPWPRSPTSERSLVRHPKGELCLAVGNALVEGHRNDAEGLRGAMLRALASPERIRELSPGCAATCSSFATSANSKAKAASCSPT